MQEFKLNQTDLAVRIFEQRVKDMERTELEQVATFLYGAYLIEAKKVQVFTAEKIGMPEAMINKHIRKE